MNKWVSEQAVNSQSILATAKQHTYLLIKTLSLYYVILLLIWMGLYCIQNTTPIISLPGTKYSHMYVKYTHILFVNLASNCSQPTKKMSSIKAGSTFDLLLIHMFIENIYYFQCSFLLILMQKIRILYMRACIFLTRPGLRLMQKLTLWIEGKYWYKLATQLNVILRVLFGNRGKIMTQELPAEYFMDDLKSKYEFTDEIVCISHSRVPSEFSYDS